VPRPSCPARRFLDDLEAERLNVLADRIAADLEVLKQVVDTINTASREEISHNRKRAKRLLVGAWVDIAGVVRALSEPVPAYRVGVGNPMPAPRRRGDEGIEDLESASVPATLEVAL